MVPVHTKEVNFMRIQHNIAALNSYRNLTNNNSAVSKNLEKLSSGYRINRAGDDAAGLAISEKMRAQITGLETAQKNGIMDKVMTIAGIVGIMVLGSMTVDMFWAEIAVEFGSGDEVTALQDVLDGILPGMFALICMGLYYWLLGKKVSPTILILGTMLVGVIGVYFGVLA